MSNQFMTKARIINGSTQFEVFTEHKRTPHQQAILNRIRQLDNTNIDWIQ